MTSPTRGRNNAATGSLFFLNFEFFFWICLIEVKTYLFFSKKHKVGERNKSNKIPKISPPCGQSYKIWAGHNAGVKD